MPLTLVLDSSAIIAVIGREEGHQALVDVIADEDVRCVMSAATYLETAIVLTFRRDDPTAVLDGLLDAIGVTVVDVTLEQARIGQAAYRRFGRGSGHPAALNCGDCFAYALARTLDAPLLFKGDDFRRTDVAAAV